MPLLEPGDLFPALTIDVAGGGTLQLPDELAGDYGVVLGLIRYVREHTPAADAA